MSNFCRWFSVAGVVLCVSCSQWSESQSTGQKPDATTEKRVAEVAASLPIDEPLRHLLEARFNIGLVLAESAEMSINRTSLRETCVGAAATAGLMHPGNGSVPFSWSRVSPGRRPLGPGQILYELFRVLQAIQVFSRWAWVRFQFDRGAAPLPAIKRCVLNPLAK